MDKNYFEGIKKILPEDAEEISIKKTNIKQRGKQTNIEEIKIKGDESSSFIKLIKKFWHLLWKDESIVGWIFSIIILFILIKFIFFPILSLITGTALPLAIVESCSMYHNEIIHNSETWWDNHEDKYKGLGIQEKEFQSFPLKNGFNKGDVLLLIKANPKKLKVGEIIIFNAHQANPVIHRIIKITEKEGGKYFSTIGDNNDNQHSFEKEIPEDKLVGKAVVKVIPYLGWLKLIFFENQKPSYEKGFCDSK